MLSTRSQLAFTFVAVALVACSSAPPDPTLQGELNPSAGSKAPKKNTGTNTNTGDSETVQDPTDPTADPALPTTPATPARPAPGTGQCAAQAGAKACLQCCDTAFPGGFDLDADVFGTCVCETPGTCAAACGTSFCAGGQPTVACEQCLTNATQCNAQAEAACNANAACSGVFACVDSSGCKTKQ